MLNVTERLGKESGREYALRMLKNNIVNLNLLPGSTLNEKDITVQLGISRTPVREALIELAKGKIVDIFPQSGSRVALIDYSLVEEARFMRTVLECAVIRLVCEDAKPEDIAMLRENVLLQEFYLENRMADKLLQLDDQFHQKLFETAGKMQVYHLMGTLMIHFDRVRSMSLEAVKDLKTVEDHKAILAAVEKKEPDKAAELMEMHLKRYQIDQEALREEYPSSMFVC